MRLIVERRTANIFPESLPHPDQKVKCGQSSLQTAGGPKIREFHPRRILSTVTVPLRINLNFNVFTWIHRAHFHDDGRFSLQKME